MRLFEVFSIAVCVLFLKKLRWPKRRNERNLFFYVSKNANLNLLPCCRYIVAGISEGRIQEFPGAEGI